MRKRVGKVPETSWKTIRKPSEFQGKQYLRVPGRVHQSTINNQQSTERNARESRSIECGRIGSLVGRLSRQGRQGSGSEGLHESPYENLSRPADIRCRALQINQAR